MKLYIQKDDGAMLEVKEVTNLNQNCKVLLFKSSNYIRNTQEVEEALTEKIGVKVVILPPIVEEVFSL